MPTPSGDDHQHGGVTKLNPNGTIHWCVCTTHPTWWGTPGAYRPTSNTGTFDMAGIVFKVDVMDDGTADGFTYEPKDTVCLGDTIFFHSNGSIQAVINWDFGDGTTANIPSPDHKYTSPGTYKVKYHIIDNAGCVTENSDSATIVVVEGEAVSVSPQELVTCDGAAPVVVKVTGGQSYQWSPGNMVSDSTAGEITLSNNGEYFLTVKIKDKAGCITTKSVHISKYYAHADAGPDKILPMGESVILNGENTRGGTIFWDANSTLNPVTSLTPTARPAVTQWYYINAKDGTCEDKDSVLVTVANFIIPNAFSPNGDHLNDFFNIATNGADGVKIELSVYNRFGQRVFHTSNPKVSWDGTFRKQACDAGTYFYSAKVTIGDREYHLKGDVTLIR